MYYSFCGTIHFDFREVFFCWVRDYDKGRSSRFYQISEESEFCNYFAMDADGLPIIGSGIDFTKVKE
jgi:hypothetical protein